MRLNIICIIIVFLILAICVGSGMFMTKITEETKALVSQAASNHSQNQLEKAEGLLQQAEALWISDCPAVGALVSQEEIDGVITELARLQSHAVTADPDDFYSTCAALQAQLDHIREKSLPTIWNIL